jgi:hypothetical protein
MFNINVSVWGISLKNTVNPAAMYPSPAVNSNCGSQISGSSHKVLCIVWDVTVTKKINAINPKVLSINVDNTGTKGNKPKGKTTFLTKLGCATTELDACINPLVKAIQGSNPANNHKPNVMLFAGNPFRLNFTRNTIENT